MTARATFNAHPGAPRTMTSGSAWIVVVLLGLGHMLVDATSILTVVKMGAPEVLGPERAAGVIGVYVLLAFALQPLFGWAVDRSRVPALAAALGAFMAAGAAMLCVRASMPALWLAGLGNSLYHVGAGAVVLSLARGKSAMPGVFVAPGDMGVILGPFLGRDVWGGGTFIVAACAVAGLFAASVHLIVETPQRAQERGDGMVRPAVAMVLLWLAIAARSYLGGVVGAPWQDARVVWIGLAAAAMFGKFSGLIADRVGWALLAVPCAVLAAPAAVLGGRSPVVAVVAMVLVQATMPVTLAGLARIVPGRPALAFGVASLAIAAGGMPSYLNWGPVSMAPAMIQLSSAAAILVALFLLPPDRAQPPVGGVSGSDQ
jgi:hypothetical protein